ncbi:MAG TPA: hypothetical protein RMH99_10865 [Sandaracinaceae bacterium LLY-WYZ-13_1]|nr:hypothetical protein [Sandaracinaceae bacterium LLY-WYZ-13_1]
MRGAAWVALATAAWLVPAALAPHPATAQPADDGTAGPAEADRRARALFDEGTRHYNAGRHLEAAEAYERAYDLSPRPLILLNVATAYERALEMGAAADALERYLDEAEAIADEEAMRERLTRLRRLARASAPSDDPAVTGEQPAGTSPTGTSPTGTSPGASVGPGAAPEPGSAPPPGAAPGFAPRPLVTWRATTAPPPDRVVSTRGPSGWAVVGGVSAGAAIVATGLAIGMGGLALDAAGTLDRACSPDGLCPATAAQTRDDARSYATAANVMGPVALALGAFTVLCAILDQTGDDAGDGGDEDPVTLSPLGLEVRF